MLESRSQTPPSTTTRTTPEVPTTTCRPLTTSRSSLGGSQAGGLRLFRSVSQFVLAFLRQTCLTYVCTQILLLPLTRLWSSSCIRALEAPGLYYDACMTYLCFRVVLWYLPVSPWSWSYTFACMISVRLNRGRHNIHMAEPPQYEGDYTWASCSLHFAYPSSFGSKSPSIISSSFFENL